MFKSHLNFFLAKVRLYTKTQKRVYSDHTFAKHSNVSFSKIMNAFKWGNQSLKTDIEYLGGKNITYFLIQEKIKKISNYVTI